jgi:acyl-coenzyme A synthetase/AMP-(fatty) acid ligase
MFIKKETEQQYSLARTELLMTMKRKITFFWHMMHNEELHKLYTSPNILRMIKSWRMNWAGHLARMREKSNAFRILAGKPEIKRTLRRPIRRWEVNIKMDLREIRWTDMNWIEQPQNRNHWRA